MHKHYPYHPLGNFIRAVDERNSSGAVSRLLGVSVNKSFIPSVANTIGTDMTNYKVVRKGQFVYVPVTSRNGEKITIAHFQEEECIVSQAYTVFEVIEGAGLLAKYLMLWFLRPEFDRYARFHSHGSAREVFDWETLCATLIPVPPLAEQERIISQFATIEERMRQCRERIALLERTATALYRKTFVEGIDRIHLPEGWRMGTLGEVGRVVTGKTPSSHHPEDFGDEMMFVTPSAFQKQRYITETERYLSSEGIVRLRRKIIPAGTLVVTCIGTVGKVGIIAEDSITNQQINSLVPRASSATSYLYHYLSDVGVTLEGQALGGSVMPMLSKSDFEKIQIPLPPQALLEGFARNMVLLNRSVLNNQRQLACLEKLKAALLTQIK